MASGTLLPLTIRDAAKADIAALTAVNGSGSEALHWDRLHMPQSDVRYLVACVDQVLVGGALLVFRRPASWSDAEDTDHLPQIVDLHIEEQQRGQGYGSQFIRAIENIVAEAGYGQLFLSVKPYNNPHAYALYQRLSYQPLQSAPYHKIWQFTDSAGILHHGEDWVVDMVKRI